MRKLLLLLLALITAAAGCAGRQAAHPPSSAAPADAPYVEISFNYTHRSGIASNQFAVWIEDSDGWTPSSSRVSLPSVAGRTQCN